ncbi:hypothetical protein GXP67_36570 [Rhodocytophaga rosea]|uniref:Uncharacterized protein n=1 Tax=Rhodocytophaga rosea TaxID=2704465 RepID=A0A6C0GUA9_9BACT|nr:hypothetical protein [Rhodocytophaga rosea]QHT71791.1 hypothetical protein GXP67_36570 [Rhodocytophaga rosea]
MPSEKQLIIKYWSRTNAFYQAKLVEKNQVSTLSQEEANKLVSATAWTDVANKSIFVKSRDMIERTYVFTPQ